jgi:hypothetical protein
VTSAPPSARASSAQLVVVARELAALAVEGQEDLASDHDSAVVAVRARDQVAMGLSVTARELWQRAARQGDHPAARWGANLSTLLRRRHTELLGPAPSDVALSPPAAPSARRWVAAAVAVETVSIQSARAGSLDRRILCAGLADVAAVAAALTVADYDLVDGLRRGGWPDVEPVATVLLGPELSLLRQTASTALRGLSELQLADQYHFTPAMTEGRIRHPHELPQSLEHAGHLLAASPALTVRECRAAALHLASLAHQLTDRLRAAGGQAHQVAALDEFAAMHLGLAHSWAASHYVWCSTGGAGSFISQLAASRQELAGAPPDALSTEDLLAAAARLPDLSDHVYATVRSSIAANLWLAGHPQQDAPPTWCDLWPGYARDADDPVVPGAMSSPDETGVRGVQELRALQRAMAAAARSAATARHHLVVEPEDCAAAVPGEVDASARVVLADTTVPVIRGRFGCGDADVGAASSGRRGRHL